MSAADEGNTTPYGQPRSLFCNHVCTKEGMRNIYETYNYRYELERNYIPQEVYKHIDSNVYIMQKSQETSVIQLSNPSLLAYRPIYLWRSPDDDAENQANEQEFMTDIAVIPLENNQINLIHAMYWFDSDNTHKPYSSKSAVRVLPLSLPQLRSMMQCEPSPYTVHTRDGRQGRLTPPKTPLDPTSHRKLTHISFILDSGYVCMLAPTLSDS